MNNQDEVNLLVNKFKNGDDEAFVLLTNYTKEPLYKTIYAIVGNQANAIEVFDEVIYKAYINLKNLKHNEFFKTWITRIAINESKNYLKKNSKIIYMEEYQEKAKTEEYEGKMDIEQAMSKLDVNTKSIVIMKLYMDYTFDDIANTMSKPVSTVKSTYYAGLEKLKKYLKVGEVN
ncbi:MAG: sigma-70 family RNA polymerase sigma factor [Clostridia bacterium]|nr:sigma-70 family RNA polymerase sigma factor [Clostridia bacterium]